MPKKFHNVQNFAPISKSSMSMACYDTVTSNTINPPSRVHDLYSSAQFSQSENLFISNSSLDSVNLSASKNKPHTFVESPVEKENKIPVDFNLLSLSYIDPNYKSHYTQCKFLFLKD